MSELAPKAAATILVEAEHNYSQRGDILYVCVRESVFMCVCERECVDVCVCVYVASFVLGFPVQISAAERTIYVYFSQQQRLQLRR